MKWFSGLEGARGLLAWVVVLSHIATQTGLLARFPVLLNLQMMGDIAVRVFIILSGFVIYHLIVEKHEPYPVYIVRRFMRIYPVYLVCLAAGIAATLATVAVPVPANWLPMPFSDRLIAEMAAAPGGLFYANVVAHLGMLHGAIPNNVLFESQYFFLSPAWSLSLEWQFYLIAPLIVWLLARPWGRIFTAVAAIVLSLAYNRGLFGSFGLPSFLPGAVFLFAIGIISRMVLPKLIGNFAFSAAALLVFGAFVILRDKADAHLVIWAVLFCYIVSQGQPKTTPVNVLSTLLDSKTAIWFGRRSYPTYLIHVPVIQGLIVLASWVDLPYWPMVIFVAVTSLVLTLGASDLLHRFVEKPGMKLGGVVADKIGRPSIRGATAPAE